MFGLDQKEEFEKMDICDTSRAEQVQSKYMKQVKNQSKAKSNSRDVVLTQVKSHNDISQEHSDINVKENKSLTKLVESHSQHNMDMEINLRSKNITKTDNRHQSTFSDFRIVNNRDLYSNVAKKQPPATDLTDEAEGEEMMDWTGCSTKYMKKKDVVHHSEANHNNDQQTNNMDAHSIDASFDSRGNKANTYTINLEAPGQSNSPNKGSTTPRIERKKVS